MLRGVSDSQSDRQTDHTVPAAALFNSSLTRFLFLLSVW